MSTTLITAEVDLDAEGRQHGYLRLPHSVNRSAYGWLPVPITVIGNGTGPVLLLLAGVHGDEYEGQIALSRLAASLAPQDIKGRVIILTMANFPAARAGRRCSPIDEGNLNRAFPGDAHGTPTQMIAHYIEEVLLPRCDVMVDLHSGGSSLFYPPTLLRGMGHSTGETAMLMRLQDAFDLPFAWVFTSGGGRQSTARTAMGAANRKGVVSVMAELGGAGMVTPAILTRTERGLRRILQALGMTGGNTPDPAEGTREMHVLGTIHAYKSGVTEPLCDIGDMVETDQEVARIHHPDTPGRAPDLVISPHQGMVLCKRVPGQVERGDALFQIAADAG